MRIGARATVLFWQQTAYSQVPQPGREQHHFLLGEVLHSFEGIDFVFQPFPASLPVKQGSTITKTRIDLVPKLDFETRRNLEGLNANPARQIEYAKHWLQWYPEDLLALYWLMEKLPQEQALEFLKPGLAVRPLWVEWHRAYQTQMEKAHPDLDLRPEYRRLLEELKGNPDAVYLLARLEGVDQGDRLFRQAAEGPNPSRFALHALGYQAMADAINLDMLLPPSR